MTALYERLTTTRGEYGSIADCQGGRQGESQDERETEVMRNRARLPVPVYSIRSVFVIQKSIPYSRIRPIQWQQYSQPINQSQAHAQAAQPIRNSIDQSSLALQHGHDLLQALFPELGRDAAASLFPLLALPLLVQPLDGAVGLLDEVLLHVVDLCEAGRERAF